MTCPCNGTDLFLGGVEEVVVEGEIGLEQVGLDAFWGLNCHFGAVLQHRHWELRTRHATQKQHNLKKKTNYVDLCPSQLQISKDDVSRKDLERGR